MSASNGAIVPIQPQALSAPARLEFSPEQRQMIRDTFANGASDSEFAVLMEVARARNLNPLLRQIHFVDRYDSMKGRKVWSTQVSIDGMRAIAERTGVYDGQDEPEFEEKDGRVTVCKVRVYRKGIGRPFVGVAHWAEYVQTKKDGGVTQFWARMPHVMLAKCAEALALRKAFPEDTAGLYVPEEMGSESVSVSAPPPPVPAQAPSLPASPATVDAEAVEVLTTPPSGDGSDPLAEFKTALAAAQDRASLNKLIKQIGAFGPDLKPQAVALYNARAKEIQ